MHLARPARQLLAGLVVLAGIPWVMAGGGPNLGATLAASATAPARPGQDEALAPVVPGGVWRAVTSPARAPLPGVTRAATAPSTTTDPVTGRPVTVRAAAYLNAARRAPAACHITPHLVAGIAQVESGNAGGRTVGPDHVVRPNVFGPVLAGGAFAAIRDTDDGVMDGTAEWDRAVGPMQFIPSTWRLVGADGDGDGTRDPQNLYDAALATATYLCRAGDLSRPSVLRSAVYSYNASEQYVADVLGWAGYFEMHGLAAIEDVAYYVPNGSTHPVRVPVPPTDPTSDPTPSRTATPTPRPSPSTPTRTTRPTSTTRPTPTHTPTSHVTSTPPTATTRPTQTSEPTATPKPTSTSKPTSTPKPSSTRTPAPEPTRTAAATSVPSSGSSHTGALPG